MFPPSPAPIGGSYFQDDLPFDLSQILFVIIFLLLATDIDPMGISLNIFSSYHRQCGLEIHMGRLRDSLTLPATQQRHPVLINAIFLWSCYMSRPSPLSQHEPHYLA